MAFRTNIMPVLQEKYASGAVASFNTALAMPLASCNIAVNAWQEGSGDPSPSNVRAIHGFSEVNITANNVIYTIQLGQEVYGAEVDVVNGVAHVTWVNNLIKNLSWTKGAADASHPYGYLYTRINDKKRNVLNIKCEVYREVPSILSSFSYDLACFGNTSSNIVYVVDSNYTNKTALEFMEDMGDYMILYELAEPFDIQLTPTQIQTLIGNNNIFCDTGDTSLIFKDLDIAKRGNFREVFKLPS